MSDRARRYNSRLYATQAADEIHNKGGREAIIEDIAKELSASDASDQMFLAITRRIRSLI